LRFGKATTSAVVIGVGFRGGRFFFRRLALRVAFIVCP